MGIVMRFALLLSGLNKDPRVSEKKGPKNTLISDLPLKKSKGLQATYIDLNMFDMKPLLEDKIFFKSTGTFNRIILGVKRSKNAYKKEIKKQSSNKREVKDQFWDEIIEEAHSLGIGLVGFAPVDEGLIFEHDHVGQIEGLYENGIVLGMEMDFEAIDGAPGSSAGFEAMRIYAELGIATNKLADHIRSKGHGAIACHPFGGPILYPAMAGRANLGELGRNGLLITREYGPRLRLSMIATDASPLPDVSEDAFNISEFCDTCRKCIKACPVNAIYEKPVHHDNGMKTMIDSNKCFEYFYKYHGCSICIKACPFHQVGYDKVMGLTKRD